MLQWNKSIEINRRFKHKLEKNKIDNIERKDQNKSNPTFETKTVK